MNQGDIAALMQGIAPVIRDTIAKAVQPLVYRLIALEAREPEKGERGDPGKDGRDGFSLDNFDTELKDDGRTLLLKFQAGDTLEVHEICLPIPLDCGVYRAETAYVKGDGVTWGGSFWIAQRDTTDKPETSDAWRLSVKKGRDGKTGEPGKPGEPGKKGDPGRDGRTY